jgi:hypothetical protein
VRWTTVTAACAAVAAALLVTACGTPRPGSPVKTAASGGTTELCYAFAVSALQRHVVVRQRPAACAGLSQAQVNQDVARAIRTVTGSEPKVVARRLAAADSRYLGALVRQVPPPPPESVETAGQSSGTSQLAVRLGAMAAWLVTAIPGAYLLTAWLRSDRRRRPTRKPGVPSALPVGHAGLAIAGLCLWIAFTVTGAAALAWADVGLTWVIAGLGMATLLASIPEQRPGASPEAAAAGTQAEMSTAAFPARAPVVIIALHGALATLTILLVLLAAVGIG